MVCWTLLFLLVNSQVSFGHSQETTEDHIHRSNYKVFKAYTAPNDVHDHTDEKLSSVNKGLLFDNTAHNDISVIGGDSSSQVASKSILMAEPVVDRPPGSSRKPIGKHHGHIHTAIDGNSYQPLIVKHPMSPHNVDDDGALFEYEKINDEQPEGRSVAAVSLGWIAAGGLLLFAFVNTLLLGTTLLLTYGVFGWFIGVLKVFAPSVAAAFSNSIAVMTAPFAADAPFEWLGF